MSTMQACDSALIMPTRFSVQRPRTWHLVMDDAGRALTERYGDDMSLLHMQDEANLRRRDHYMQQVVSRRQAAMIAAETRGRTRFSPSGIEYFQVPCKCRPNMIPFQIHEGSGTVENMGVTYRNLNSYYGGNESDKKQHLQQCAASYGGIFREVPVSLFH